MYYFELKATTNLKDGFIIHEPSFLDIGLIFKMLTGLFMHIQDEGEF